MDKTKILADFEALERNEFWKVYIKSLTEYSESRMAALETAPLDQLSKIQGQREAIKLALGKPEYLIKELTKEA